MKKLVAIVFALSLLTACSQTPKKQEPKPEPPKAETPKAETPKPKPPKPESPKVKAPKSGGSTQLTTDFEKFSYAIGSMQGNNLSRDVDQNGTGAKLDKALLAKGYSDGLNDKSSMTQAETLKLIRDYQEKLQEARIVKQDKEAKASKIASEAFLKENAKKKNVTVTASGLQYQVLNKGDGKIFPKLTDRVKVHYTGTLIDGTVFDSSVDRGSPAQFAVSGVIKGWIEGLQLMSKGARYKFFIPAELAYGSRSTGKISANSALIFDVDLLDVTSK